MQLVFLLRVTFLRYRSPHISRKAEEMFFISQSSILQLKQLQLPVNAIDGKPILSANSVCDSHLQLLCNTSIINEKSKITSRNTLALISCFQRRYSHCQESTCFEYKFRHVEVGE